MFLLVAALALLLPANVGAENLLSSRVDLTAKKAQTTSHGLREFKNQPTKRLGIVAPQAKVATQQQATAKMKRDAVAKAKAMEAPAAVKQNGKKLKAVPRGDSFNPIEQYPYLNTFQTPEEQEAFTIVDANGDNITWDFAYNSDDNWFARYSYNEWMAADDWLISPAFHFEAGKQYSLTFDAWNKGADERIEVLVGTEAAPGAMTILALGPTDIMWEEPQMLQTKFAISETGTYFIGFHAISDADMYRLFVDNVMVDPYELEAPAAPTGLTAVQTEEQLEVTLNFTAPTVKRNGDSLTGNLEKIELMRDGQVIHTFENVAPGSALSFVDNGDDLTIGVHNYQVVPYNDKGAGDKSEEVTVKVITTLSVPYTADLTQHETFGVFTIIDANDDGTTWTWDDSYHTNYIITLTMRPTTTWLPCPCNSWLA